MTLKDKSAKWQFFLYNVLCKGNSKYLCITANQKIMICAVNKKIYKATTIFLENQSAQKFLREYKTSQRQIPSKIIIILFDFICGTIDFSSFSKTNIADYIFF